MKKRSFIAMLAVLAMVVAGTVIADESAKSEKKFDLDKALAKLKCPVSGRALNKEATAKYKEGKVYFCCMNCPKGFAKNTEKYAVKANHQLVATQQYEQKACPVSGRPCKAEHKSKLVGLEVAFCCPNCKGAVDKAEGDAKLAKAFDDKAFKKAYTVAKKKDKDEKKAA